LFLLETKSVSSSVRQFPTSVQLAPHSL